MPARCVFGAFAFLFAAVVWASPPHDDLDSLRQDVETLRAGQAALRQDIQDLKALLRRAGPSAMATTNGPADDVGLSLEGATFKGSSQSSLVLVEFSDFQCPFCARYASTTYPRIVHDYVDTGRLRYAFVNFPIESLHAESFRAHVAAACAADQGRFWEMHDRLFTQPQSTDLDSLTRAAVAVGVDAEAFRACVDSQGHAAAIRDGIKVGSGIGVVGTPTFLIGTVGPGNAFKALKVIAGAKPYEAFAHAIDEQLAAMVPTSKEVSGPSLGVLPPGAGTRVSVR